MKRIAITAVSLCMVGIIGLCICYGIVSANASDRIFDDVNDVPELEYGLLLGTSPITPQGAHNRYFDNRIKAAVELYNAGKIKKIIASGGDYSGKQKNGCNELEAMRDSLLAHDVYPQDIILDYEGTRTVNSIVKVKEGMKIDSCVIISQEYHNQRAIWLADHYGLKAIGYNAAPSPFRKNRVKNIAREVFARPKMFLDLWFSHKPDVADEYVDSDTEDLGSWDNHDFLVSLNTIDGHNEQDTIVGNFTGNGNDTLYVKTVISDSPNIDVYEKVKYYAVSNNRQIPRIELWGYINLAPKLVFEGDLDGDGKDEWGYLHTWIYSQRRFYRVFTLRNNKWVYLVFNDLLDTGEAFRRSGLEILEPANRKGYVKINYLDDSKGVDNYEIRDTVVRATYTPITIDNK